MKPRIHLNSAGAGRMSAATRGTIVSHLELETEIGAMEAGVQRAPEIDQTRTRIARLLGAQVQEIVLGHGGSALWGVAFASLPEWTPNDRIWVSRQEWGSNLALIQERAARTGARLEVMPCTEDGTLNIAACTNRLDRTVRAIFLTWLPANGGLINDAYGLGALAQQVDAAYFVDAGQAVGQLPIDVARMGCDVLKSAGRKHLRGPRGTGLMFVRNAFAHSLVPTYRDVSGFNVDGARKLEMTETSIANCLGLGTALIELEREGLDQRWARIQALARYARRRIADEPLLQLRDLGAQNASGQSGLVAFTPTHGTPFALKDHLSTRDINIGANGIAYTPLDMRARGLDQIARISLCAENDETEIDTCIEESVQWVKEQGKR